MTRRHHLADIGAALLTGIMTGTGIGNVFGAINAASPWTALGFATIATIEFTCALIVYSTMTGTRDDRDQ